jgi:hypothetical protein
MNKLDFLINQYPDELTYMVDKLFDEKVPKKITGKSSKTIYKFIALGKKYDDDKFVNNYREFLKDISKILSFEVIRDLLGNSWVYEHSNDPYNEDKINNAFYVRTKSSTETKINHIKKLCDYLGINIEDIYYWSPNM